MGKHSRTDTADVYRTRDDVSILGTGLGKIEAYETKIVDRESGKSYTGHGSTQRDADQNATDKRNLDR